MHRLLKFNYSCYKSRIMGFALSIILTTVPFIMVIDHLANYTTLKIVLIICVIMQIALHLIYFLDLHTLSKQKWGLIAFIFTIIIITILIVGTLWIMSCLNYNLSGR